MFISEHAASGQLTYIFFFFESNENRQYPASQQIYYK